MNYMELSN